MKRVCLFVAMVLCSSLAAGAQTVQPPQPPQPSAPPAPVPAAPRPAPAPPTPPVPFVVAPPVYDRFVIEDAVRESQKALMDLDIDSIKAQAEIAKEQAMEMSRQAFEMKDFAFADGVGQGVGVGVGRGIGGPIQNTFTIGRGGDAYSAALSLLDRRQYDQAITRFEQVVAQKGTHADGALYHKAFAQYKLGKSEDALASLAELRKTYPQSRYLKDAGVLEADVKKSSGKAVDVTSEDNNEEIKLIAIQTMQNSEPERAIPLLENVLKSTNSLPLKRKALYVLAQNDQPSAHQILVSYAKGSGNPDLQIEAIRYLAQRKKQTTSSELMEIYNSTQDLDVRRAVLGAFVATGDKATLLRLAGGDSPVPIRNMAISNMGSANLLTPQELMQLYAKEENKDLRETMVRSFSSMGAVEQLTQVIKTEKEPSVRQTAIRSLGNMKAERTGQTLSDIYGSETDKDTRKAVISALSSQNNAEGLVAIARKETSSELKLEIVRRIANLAPKNKVAMDYLMDQIK